MRTLSELDALITQMHEFDIEATAVRNRASEIQKKADELKQTILQELEAQGVQSFKGNSGTVTIGSRFAVKMPTDPDLKDELRDFLTAREAFNALWSINYATLNSWFKAEAEAAKEAGVYLDVPGLEPKADKYLSFRKGTA